MGWSAVDTVSAASILGARLVSGSQLKWNSIGGGKVFACLKGVGWISSSLLSVDTTDVNTWGQTRDRQLTAKAAEREAEKVAKKAEKEVKKAEKEAKKAEKEVRKAEKEARKAEREVIRVEKEARKAEREAETAGKEVEKDTENKRNINGKAAQSNGNKKTHTDHREDKKGKERQGGLRHT